MRSVERPALRQLLYNSRMPNHRCTFLEWLPIHIGTRTCTGDGCSRCVQVSGVALVIGTCLTPLSCFAGVALMGPPTAVGAIGTYYLFQGTIQVFRHEFIETTP